MNISNKHSNSNFVHSFDFHCLTNLAKTISICHRWFPGAYPGGRTPGGQVSHSCWRPGAKLKISPSPPPLNLAPLKFSSLVLGTAWRPSRQVDLPFFYLFFLSCPPFFPFFFLFPLFSFPFLFFFLAPLWWPRGAEAPKAPPPPRIRPWFLFGVSYYVNFQFTPWRVING